MAAEREQYIRCPLNGAVTMLFGEDGVRLEVRDEASRQTFLYVEVSADQVSKMLGRLSFIPCKFGLHAVERVGLQQEYKQFEFPMPPADYANRKEIAAETARNLCPEGWEADEHFSSQGSFYRDGEVEMARTFIRRYVKPTEAQS